MAFLKFDSFRNNFKSEANSISWHTHLAISLSSLNCQNSVIGWAIVHNKFNSIWTNSSEPRPPPLGPISITNTRPRSNNLTLLTQFVSNYFSDFSSNGYFGMRTCISSILFLIWNTILKHIGICSYAQWKWGRQFEEENKNRRIKTSKKLCWKEKKNLIFRLL